MPKSIPNLNRKAVGSIIGGVFLVLIFTSMFTTYFVIENSKRSLDEVYINRYEFEAEKQQENLQFISVYKKSNNSLNITVQNTGAIGTSIVYVGEINELGNDIYHKINVFCNPSETVRDITQNSISVNKNETKKLLLLTSYGNSYLYTYNEKKDNGTGRPTAQTLTISVSGTGTTTPSAGVHSYLKGTNVDVTANPGGEYIFNHWVLDGSSTGSANPIAVSMDTDHSLEAVFTESVITLMDDNFTDLNNWGSTSWQIQTDQYYSAPSSVKSSNGNEGNLQSIGLNTSGASSLTISFWYRLSGGVDATDVDFMIYDGSGGPDLIANLFGVEDIWVYYNYTTTDPQYFIPDFYIRFNSNLRWSETVWIDDIKVIVNYP